MNWSRPPLRRFWSTESGLTGLLIFTLGYLIVVNSLSEFTYGRLLARLVPLAVIHHNETS